jgi:hypothetical protein
MALASLVFALLGILALISLCAASGYLLRQHTFWLLVPVLIPSILAVICGHIGKRRAKTVHGLGESYDMAAVGLVLGYLFGGLYLAIALSTLVLFFLHMLIR